MTTKKRKPAGKKKRTARATDFDRRVGQNIRDERIRQGMSLAALGRMVRKPDGVSQVMVYKWESARVRLSLSTFVEIAEALKLPVQSLLAGATLME